MLVAELGSGPPIVLIHGLGGTFRYWLESARHLAEHFRVLMPDVPGFGGSDPAARPFSMDAAGERVLVACEQLGALRPVLVGHSLGGPIAALAAAQAPGRVGGVVLISTTGLSPSGPGAAMSSCPSCAAHCAIPVPGRTCSRRTPGCGGSSS